MKLSVLLVFVLVLSVTAMATHEQKWKGGDCYDASGACTAATKAKYDPIMKDIVEKYHETKPSWDTGFTGDPAWIKARDDWYDANENCGEEYDSCLAKDHSYDTNVLEAPEKPAYTSEPNSLGDCNTRYRGCIDWANDKQLQCLDEIEIRYDECQSQDGENCNAIRNERKQLCDAPEVADQKTCQDDVKICNKPFQETTEDDEIVEETDNEEVPANCQSTYDNCLAKSQATFDSCSEQNPDQKYDTCLPNWQKTNSNCISSFEDCGGKTGLDVNDFLPEFDVHNFNWDVDADDLTEGILACSKVRTNCFTVATSKSEQRLCDDKQDECVARVERLLESEEHEEEPEIEEDEYDPDALIDGEIRIVSIKGEVEMARADGAPYFVPEIGDLLREGYEINTGLDTEITLEWPDGSIVIVRDLTFLHIDEYYFGDEQQITQLHVRTGAVRVIVREQSAIRSGFSVTTPTSTASVRGTEFEVKYDESTGESEIKTFKGTVAVADIKGNSVEVNAGEEISVQESLGELVVFDTSLHETVGLGLWWIVILIIVAGAGFFVYKQISN